MKDKYIWNIEYEESQNEWDANYIDMILRWCERKFGEKFRKILDVACGWGRYHPYLRNLGYEVWGVDISDELIEEAKKRNKGYEEFYEVKDMRALKKTGFDAILSWFTSFGYFSDEENQKVLENFAQALRKGGILILDVPTGSTKYVEEMGDILKISDVKVDKQVWKQSVYEKVGEDVWKKVDEKVIPVRFYSVDELKEMLYKAGFEIVQILRRKSVNVVSNATQVCIIARRKK